MYACRNSDRVVKSVVKRLTMTYVAPGTSYVCDMRCVYVCTSWGKVGIYLKQKLSTYTSINSDI